MADDGTRDLLERARRAVRDNGHPGEETPEDLRGDNFAEAEYARERQPQAPRPEPGPVSEPWPAPVDLAEVPEAPPFPLQTLPGDLRLLVEEIAWAMSCAPDLAGVALLTLAGGAIANARHLAITETHMQPPCLFAAVVAAPGMAKSPPLRLLRHPFDLAEKQNRHDYQVARQVWDQADSDTRGERPTLRRCLVSNATTESLQAILNDNPRGVLMIRNEIAGLVAGLNQYKQGGDDRQFYLELWDGSPIITDRKSDRQQGGAPVFVRDAFCGIYGTIQPDVVPLLRGSSRKGEAPVNDGFLDRWLFAFPQQMPAVEEHWRAVHQHLRDGWDATVSRLLSLRMTQQDGEHPRPGRIGLDPDARAAWTDFTRAHAMEVNHEDFPAHLTGPWVKLRAYGARLALILHCLRWARSPGWDDEGPTDLDGDSMDAAARLVSYFKGGAKKIYMAMDADPALAGARRLLAWIRRHRHPQITKRDAYMGTRPTFKRVAAMETSLQTLERHHFIRPRASARQGPGRPSEEYEVNPATFIPMGQNARNAQNYAQAHP